MLADTIRLNPHKQHYWLVLCVYSLSPPPDGIFFTTKSVPASACCGYDDIPLTCAAAEPDSDASGKKDESRCTLALSRNKKKYFQLQWAHDNARVTFHTFGKFDEIYEVCTC